MSGKNKSENILKKDMELELTIEDMGVDGEGIGKAEGVTLFVKDAVLGDRVRVKVMKMKKHYGYARMMEILTPSPYRVEPKCAYHRQCGGCQIQAVAYEKQLEFKENKVRNNLKRIGGFAVKETDGSGEGLTVNPVIGMEEPYFYRNKAQFPIGTDKNGKIITGFYASRSHNIIPNRRCYLGVEINEKILDIVISFMEKYHISAYDEATGKGLVRHVLIRFGFTTKEIMVCLVVNGKKLPYAEKLVEQLTAIEGMTSITLNVNEKNTNVILGEQIISLWGQDYITDYIGDIQYQISPLSFYQVNPIQTEKLYGTALEYAGLTGKETVWDLYCGIGTISLFLAQKAKQVYGVEIVPAAISDAKNNAKINGIENVTFFVGKAEEVLPDFYEKGMEKSKITAECQESGKPMDMLHPDVIVVDPPRKGCDEKCLETIVKMKPERVVYVSCESATLARDLKYLCEQGYEVKKVQPVDMFPQGGHVETVVLLSQQKPDDVIEVEIELDELDLTSAESKATYKEIQEYVLKEHGLKVSNLYISQVKRKCGIEVGENYNLPKSEDSRQPQCPEEKEKAIRDALEHFGMI